MSMLRKGFITALVSSIAAGGALVVWRYRRDIQAARKRVHNLSSQVIETDCGLVEFLDKGDGYPVLVVHGALGGFDQGLFLSRNIDAPNIRIICVSRFGYLRSPLPPGADLNMQADVYASLLDALGVQQTAVFAVSAGTTSAIRFAARHPQRVSALVLIGPDAPGEMQIALPPRFVFDRLMRSDFLYWALTAILGKRLLRIKGLVPEGFVLTEEQQALVNLVQFGDQPISQRMDGMIFETFTCLDAFIASVAPNSPYPLSQIQTPTLVVNALDDPISVPENVRRLAGQMPNARLYTLPDGGHLFFGHTSEVRAEINRFLFAHVAALQASR